MNRITRTALAATVMTTGLWFAPLAADAAQPVPRPGSAHTAPTPRPFGASEKPRPFGASEKPRPFGASEKPRPFIASSVVNVNRLVLRGIR